MQRLRVRRGEEAQHLGEIDALAARPQVEPGERAGVVHHALQRQLGAADLEREPLEREPLLRRVEHRAVLEIPVEPGEPLVEVGEPGGRRWAVGQTRDPRGAADPDARPAAGGREREARGEAEGNPARGLEIVHQ